MSDRQSQPVSNEEAELLERMARDVLQVLATYQALMAANPRRARDRCIDVLGVVLETVSTHAIALDVDPGRSRVFCTAVGERYLATIRPSRAH